MKDKLGIATEHSGVQVSEQQDGALNKGAGVGGVPSGSAALSANLPPTLGKIAASLDEYPKTSVTVVGYTHSVGSSELKRDLRMRRQGAPAVNALNDELCAP